MANEVIKRGNLRAYLQFGGPGPLNKPLYAGQDMSYVAITGATAPESGKIDPVNVHDPNRFGKFKRVARTVAAPDLAKADVMLREPNRKGKLPRNLTRIGCAFNAYELVGDCKALSDYVGGWTNYILIYPELLVMEKSLGDRTAFDQDDVLETSLSCTLRDNPYPVGPMQFGQASVTLTGIPVTDVTYSGNALCGDCGDADNGSERLYASANSATGAKPNVYYSLDSGATWTAINVATAANDEDLLAIAVFGSNLVALSRTAGGATTGGYYYSPINSLTGVPSSTFTKVSTGFVSNKQPNDWVVIGNEMYIVCDGGYIHKLTDLTAGVTTLSAGGATTQNLLRIDGTQDALVAAGASDTVVKSLNRGQTWAATTTAPTLTSGNAVAVVDSYKYWAGGTNGKLYYTINGGETWVEKTFSGSGAGAVTDIIAVTPEVLYFSHNTAAPVGRVFTTWDGGFTWTNAAPRLGSLPTFTGANRLAAPLNTDADVAVNNLAVVGTGAVAADGIILMGSVGIF